MESLIKLALQNFSVTLLLLGLLAAVIALLAKHKAPSYSAIIEALFSYFLLFNIGIGYLYNFVMHVFYGDMVAAFIGWEQSPFQLEIGFASLGFSAIGFISFPSQLAFRAATVIAPSFFLLGAAGGHMYQMVTSHNFAPGNAGSIFWTDLILPAMGFVLLGLQYRLVKQGACHVA